MKLIILLLLCSCISTSKHACDNMFGLDKETCLSNYDSKSSHHRKVESDMIR